MCDQQYYFERQINPDARQRLYNDIYNALKYQQIYNKYFTNNNYQLYHRKTMMCTALRSNIDRDFQILMKHIHLAFSSNLFSTFAVLESYQFYRRLW
ncbi:hypothetical protein FGO68_gene5143 [Halteria grandinella]|uniref:Uncharacterized protein n=1 Tax=Halteria grandinella TaxID=5974 RepID=A0A8J8TA66_HALGN|nr:hypothetical protein FGO68_gene5143 [Halteria grandinella]